MNHHDILCARTARSQAPPAGAARCARTEGVVLVGLGLAGGQGQRRQERGSKQGRASHFRCKLRLVMAIAGEE